MRTDEGRLEDAYADLFRRECAAIFEDDVMEVSVYKCEMQSFVTIELLERRLT